MSILQIHTYPESILKKKAKPVKNIDNNIRTLIDNMFETMYNALGIGLAATQIGEESLLFLMDVHTEDEKKHPMVFINPKIVESSGEASIEEGCLSLPGFRINVKRNDQILVSAFDLNEKEIFFEAKGLTAIVIQHEMDHLIGITLLDKTSLLKREAYIRSLKKGRTEHSTANHHSQKI